MTALEEFKDKATVTTDKESVKQLVQQISHIIDQSSQPIEWLRLRATLWVKLDEKGYAINDYRHILKLSPEDVHAAGQLELLITILRYSNSDIYANTNTHMDPWLE